MGQEGLEKAHGSAGPPSVARSAARMGGRAKATKRALSLFGRAFVAGGEPNVSCIPNRAAAQDSERDSLCRLGLERQRRQAASPKDQSSGREDRAHSASSRAPEVSRTAARWIGDLSPRHAQRKERGAASRRQERSV